MGKHILLVEDDIEQRMLYQMMMTMNGHEVEAVGDVETALKQLAQRAYDLVVTDWYLPDIMGDQLVSEAHRRYPGLKTILISSHDHVCDAACAAGADGWYWKSDDLCYLERMIAGLIAN